MAQFITLYLLGPLGFVLVLGALVILRWFVFWRAEKNARYLPFLDQKSLGKQLQPIKYTMDIAFENLGLKLRSNDKVVLEGVTGMLKHGRTTAVMGPSGSGKTTFITTVSGRVNYGTEIGRIFLNSEEGSLRNYPKLVGFVPQEDVMHRDLTVEEILRFSALVRLPNELSYAEKMQVVGNVIVALGLSEIRHSLIGDENVRGISGGQRKRVNVGIELVADPAVLFLDEPTSGLDSTASKELCKCLQSLSSLGLTIVAVIHQPRYEIFTMFDDVLFLGKGGVTCYMGPTATALDYFESLGFECPAKANPADFLMDVLGGEVPLPGHPDFTPSQLPVWWNERARRASTPLSLNVVPRISRSSSLNSTDELSPLLQVAAQINDDEDDDYSLKKKSHQQESSSEFLGRAMYRGTTGEFVGAFCACLFSVGLALFFCVYRREGSKRWQNGAAIGTMTVWLTCVAMGVVALAQDWTMHLPVVYKVMHVMTVSVCVVTVVPMWIASIYRARKGKDPWVVSHWAMGLVGFPFYYAYLIYRTDLAMKYRYAAILGSVTMMLSFSPFFYLQLTNINRAFSAIYTMLPLTLIACFIAITHRVSRIPSFDRQTANFAVQTWYVFRRSLVQQTRFLWPTLFELTLPCISAIFIGIIYFNRYYQDPLIVFLDNGKCPPDFPKVVCLFLDLSPDDPIPGQATLTTLSLALAAVSSALGIFGNDQAVFVRESHSSLSTSAYYLGKSLAHLINIALAPLGFTFFYYALAQPRASLLEYYGIFFMIYFICSGLGYLVSILVPVKIAQLAGVLVVLMSMTFSGANPTITQLKHNALIPDALYFPTFGSVFRWSSEMFYLTEIKHYNATVQPFEQLYGYTFSNYQLDWAALVVIAYIFRIATYVALIKREE